MANPLKGSHMADNEKLARMIADALVDRMREIMPVSFLVYDTEMARLVSIVRLTKDKKHQVTDDERQRIHDTILHVYNEAKPFTQEHMDMMIHGIELAEAEADEAEKSKTTKSKEKEEDTKRTNTEDE